MDSKEVWGCFLMSGLWSEHAAHFKRLMKIYSSPPIRFSGLIIPLDWLYLYMPTVKRGLKHLNMGYLLAPSHYTPPPLPPPPLLPPPARVGVLVYSLQGDWPTSSHTTLLSTLQEEMFTLWVKNLSLKYWIFIWRLKDTKPSFNAFLNNLSSVK